MLRPHIFETKKQIYQFPIPNSQFPIPNSQFYLKIMDYKELVPQAFDLSPYQFGMPQQSGSIAVVPIFGPNRPGFTGPISGLKLSKVTGYGSVELANPGATGVAIVPLHIGYIQDGAQNHALCRSAFIAAGQKLLFEDACCVQESQGGYLEGRDQWFFILPVKLRAIALSMRGEQGFGKLWDNIAELNQEFGLESRGHLEQILTRQRGFLTQYQSRLELLPGQTGALFFIGDKLVGVEIAPSAAYFEEVWMPLVCFCYGAAAMGEDRKAQAQKKEGQKAGSNQSLPPEPFAATNLRELREQLQQSRFQLQQQMRNYLEKTPAQKFEIQEEERFLNMRLQTATSRDFAGQFVEEDGELVYASLFATPKFFSPTP